MYRLVRSKITGKRGIIKEGGITVISEGEAEYFPLLKKYQANKRRVEKEEALRSLGLVKVKGALGGVYWE